MDTTITYQEVDYDLNQHFNEEFVTSSEISNTEQSLEQDPAQDSLKYETR